MNSKETLERFRELNNNNEISCTEQELNSFLMCGILLKSKNSYITRMNVPIKINIVKPKTTTFNLDFTNIINTAEQLASENKIHRVYCMTSRCYNMYKEAGYIITKSNKEYFRIFENELWLVAIIN